MDTSRGLFSMHQETEGTISALFGWQSCSLARCFIQIMRRKSLLYTVSKEKIRQASEGCQRYACSTIFNWVPTFNALQAINPLLTSFIAHRKPEMCPIGALAILHHYLYDVRNLATMEQIDWSLNKSWRQVCWTRLKCCKFLTDAFRRFEFYIVRNQWQVATASRASTTSMSKHLAVLSSTHQESKFIWLAVPLGIIKNLLGT